MTSLLLSGLTLIATPASAATFITSGTYDNNPIGIGYDTTTSGSPYYVSGGDFSHNSDFGFAAESGTTVYISGGTYSNNNVADVYANNSAVTISGGSFNDNLIAATNNATVDVTGGDFYENATELLTTYGGTVTLTGYGLTFSDGQGGTSRTGGIGSVTGYLENSPNTLLSFAYNNENGATTPGSIVLDNISPAPEPSQVATLGFIGIGLAGLMLRARKRRAV